MTDGEYKSRIYSCIGETINVDNEFIVSCFLFSID